MPVPGLKALLLGMRLRTPFLPTASTDADKTSIFMATGSSPATLVTVNVPVAVEVVAVNAGSVTSMLAPLATAWLMDTLSMQLEKPEMTLNSMAIMNLAGFNNGETSW